MLKYFMRYLIFWLPAALVGYFFNSTALASQVAQWFFAFLMVFGWAANTGMFAYHYPRNTLSLILAYTGVSILLIMAMYTSTVSHSSAAYWWMRTLVGLFSFGPLSIFLKALQDFNIQTEMYVTVGLAVVCLLGYCVGVVYRRIRPNPYRPKMYRPQM